MKQILDSAKRRLHHHVIISVCLILGEVFLQAANSAVLFPSSPLSPLATFLSMGNKSDPDQNLGLPSSLPYSSHTPIYCFPPGSHRNPCLWAWQEATVLLCGVVLCFFFNI